jgi:hypothetical protein
MKRLITTVLIFLAAVVGAQAQTTTVTATIIDPNGTIYISGSYSVSLVNTTTQQPLFGGNANFQQQYFGQTLSVAGGMSVVLPSVTSMTPQPGLQWKFSICANPLQIAVIWPPVALPCFSYTSTGTQISGTSVDISASLKPVAPIIPLVTASTAASLPPGISAWSQVGSCYDASGSLVLQYDPLNLSGTGPFPCLTGNRLNAVIQKPSGVNGSNIIQPGDLVFPNLTLKAVASQTQPILDVRSSTGASLALIDALGNASFQTVNILNASPLSTFKQVAAPGTPGSLLDFVYVDSVTKRLATVDDSGVVTPYIGPATTKTFTQTTFDTAGAGNVFKINAKTINDVTGSGSTTVPLSGTIAGTSQLVCTDSGGTLTLTTSACPGIAATTVLNVYDTTSATQTGSISATTMVTSPSASPGTLYQINFYVFQVAAGTSCTGNTTITAKIIFTDPNASASATLGIITFSITNNGTANTSAGIQSGAGFAFPQKPSTVVQYSTTFAAGTNCSPAPTYTITPILTQLKSPM